MSSFKFAAKFGEAPDWVGFNKETMEFAKTLTPNMRGRLLKKMAEVEWCKCRDDIEYWLDAEQHMPTEEWPKGTPYVFTHDPHAMYKCNKCPKSEENFYPFHQLAPHLEFRHEIEEKNPARIRAYFHEIPSVRPFPYHLPYIKPILDYWQLEPLFCIEKSRDMVATWTVVMMYTWDTLFHEGAQNIFQSLTAAKAYDLVDRAWRIYRAQPKFLKIFKATKVKGDMKGGVLEVPELGSMIMGFPQDPDTVRQFHPRGLFQDEAAFMPKAGDAFAAAKPTIQNGGRYTAISSATASWFQMLCNDTLSEYED
jgi:hypothetical protein